MVFRFASPEWLWLLLLLPVYAAWRGKRGEKASLRFPAADLARRAGAAARGRPGKSAGLLRLLVLTLLITGLARPQSGSRSSETEASGIDIVLAIDLSGSMWAHDFELRGKHTDRLSVVKRVVKDFIGKRPNDRIGIVAFATEPFLVSPLTLNHDWLLGNLERLKIGLIDPTRTAIGSALAVSANRLRGRRARSRIIILLTDGASNSGTITPAAAAEAAAACGIKIYAIGAGREGIVPIPRTDRHGNPLRDRRGNLIFGRGQSDIDLETLEKIADLTSAKFYRATNTRELNSIYKEIDKLEKTDIKMRFRTAYDEKFAWPAAAGLILLGLEQILSQTRLRRLP